MSGGGVLTASDVRRAALWTALGASLLALLWLTTYAVLFIRSFPSSWLEHLLGAECAGLVLFPLALGERPATAGGGGRRALALLAAATLVLVWAQVHPLLFQHLRALLTTGSLTGSVSETWNKALAQVGKGLPSLQHLLLQVGVLAPLVLLFSARIERYALRWQLAYVVLGTVVVSGLSLWGAALVAEEPPGPQHAEVLRRMDRTRGTFTLGVAVALPLAAAAADRLAHRLDARLFASEPPRAEVAAAPPPIGRLVALAAAGSLGLALLLSCARGA